MTLRLNSWSAALAAVITLAFSLSVHASPPRVVATIAPVHSLVAAVTDGVTTPVLLLPGTASPHSHAMKPSQARALQRAELVVWVGPALETFLQRSLHDAIPGSRVLTLMDLSTVRVLGTRRGGRFDDHGHEHGHESSSHAHDAAPHGKDPHIWLDPDNALAIVEAVATTLSRMDADNAARYRDNAARTRERIAALDRELRDLLAPVADTPFLVFHDAYHAFELHYGLHAAGAVTLDPQRAPGAARVRELRHQIEERGVRCVFREPQFEPRLVNTLVAGTEARIGVLDPMGAGVAPGPQAWFELMRGLAGSFAACLSAR